eukprot:261834-Prymnesium_polylepis.1
MPRFEANVEQLLDDSSQEYEAGVDASGSSKKRKLAADGRDDKATPYLPKDETHLWTDLGGGAWGGRSPPLLGGNVVTA